MFAKTIPNDLHPPAQDLNPGLLGVSGGCWPLYLKCIVDCDKVWCEGKITYQIRVPILRWKKQAEDCDDETKICDLTVSAYEKEQRQKLAMLLQKNTHMMLDSWLELLAYDAILIMKKNENFVK